jgi:hypothetical protein
MRRRAEFLKEQEQERLEKEQAQRQNEERRRAMAETQSTSDFSKTGRQLVDEGVTDPRVYANVKGRYYDPTSMSTPQSLGYGRSHRHFFSYTAPVLGPEEPPQ